MTTIGYFCSAGYTETGGIDAFLKKVNPNVKWVRCFPVVEKPAPKKGRVNKIPKGGSGISGSSLIRKMLDVINDRRFDKGKYDTILLIDDLDCRFDGQKEDTVLKYIMDIKCQVNQVIGREIDFHILFASPEIESWFIADWLNSFAKEYPKLLATLLRQRLRKIMDLDGDSIEDYGGPLVNGSCSKKLSEVIQVLLFKLQLEQKFSKQYSYSKRIEGPAMLSRIDPSAIAKKCRSYFAPVFHELCALG